MNEWALRAELSAMALVGFGWGGWTTAGKGRERGIDAGQQRRCAGARAGVRRQVSARR
jgi:hypothetical protein